MIGSIIWLIIFFLVNADYRPVPALEIGDTTQFPLHFSQIDTTCPEVFRYQVTWDEVPDTQFEVFEQLSVPDSAIWGICRYCSLFGSILRAKRLGANDSLLLSRSMWEEFFFSQHNDKYFLTQSDSFTTLLIENPVFIIPMITFHPGHILIDLLEELYALMSDAGKVPNKDALIVIDVAPAAERDVLDEIIRQLTGSGRHIGSMLKLLSDNIYTLSNFMEKLQKCNFIFKSIYVGVDLTYSSYYHGYRFSRGTFSTFRESSFFSFLSKKYESFSEFMRLEFSGNDEKPSDGNNQILFIQRKNNRVVDNMVELVSHGREKGFNTTTVDLSTIEINEQLRLFDRARLITATGGTAIHNAIWFQSPLVLFMPPLWCDWSWVYRNSVELRGLKVYLICNHIFEGIGTKMVYFQWSRKAWLQPPRLTKSSNFSVSRDRFSEGIEVIFFKEGDAHSSSCASFQSSFAAKVFDDRLGTLISSIDVEEGSQDGISGWHIVLEGNVFGNFRLLSTLLRSSRSFTVCMRPLADFGIPWCSEVFNMNYYSTLRVFINRQKEVFHYWLQASSSGGKFRGTDVILPVDCELLDCGYRFQGYEPNKSDLILDLCEDHASYSQPCQVIEIRGNRNGAIYWKELGFNFLLTECERLRLSKEDCSSVALRLLHRFHNQAILKNATLPLIQYLPTPANPFVFLHIDKCGGTTIREMVVNAAKKFSLQYFVPCYGTTPCFTFGVNEGDNAPVQNTSVVAGHFEWKIWEKLEQCHNSSCQQSCLIIARSPIDRILSYYHQRFFKEENSGFYGIPFNEINVRDWRRVIVEHRFARWKDDNKTVIVVDEGMSDSMCRTLLGRRTSTGIENPHNLALPTQLTEVDALQAIENTKKCVIGMTDRWSETLTLISSWFPWIHISEEIRLNTAERGYRDDEIRQDLLDVILEHNRCDLHLYSEMKQIFENQLYYRRKLSLHPSTDHNYQGK